MSKALILILIIICVCSCKHSTQQHIEFKPLHTSDFNAKPLETFNGRKMFDSIMESYDSCKSFRFNANAILITKHDTDFFIGSVINRQSLAVVNTIYDLGIAEDDLVSQFNIINSTCYEKRELHLSLRTLLGDSFSIQLPGAGEAINKELNNDIIHAEDKELQTGSWLYLDFKDALAYVMDTVKTAAGLAYKKNLLDTNNMVLTTAESLSDVSFFIETEKAMSDSLKILLQQKPYAMSSVLKTDKRKIQLYYISDNKFQVHFTGLYPVAGEFMKAE